MKPGPGSLLIAPPTMKDGRFAKSVLLITNHSSAGTHALCLNKPTRHTLKGVAEEIGLDKELPFQIYWGGPVHNGSIWMIHDTSWENDTTLYVNDKWKVTSNEEMFFNMADGDCPRDFRIMSGFASWMPGQLEMELNGTPPFNKKSSWLVVDEVDPEWVFNTPIDELWDDALALAGNQAVSSWL